MSPPVRSMVPREPFRIEQIAAGVSLRRLYPGGLQGPNGATANGLTYGWVGFGVGVNDGPPSTIRNFTVWNHHNWGLFAYDSANLTIDGFVARGKSVNGNGAIDGLDLVAFRSHFGVILP